MQTVGLGGETPWVLLVEDDLDTASVQREMLMEWEVRHAATAAKPRQLLKEQRPILVLLDLGLPDNEGLAVCVEIRRSYSDLLILVCSGRNDPREVRRCSPRSWDFRPTMR